MANTFGRIVKNIGTGIFERTKARLLGAGIPVDSRIGGTRTVAKWSGRSDKKDWRVRLQVPDGPLQDFFDFPNNPLLKPLAGSRGMFWPLTPMMQIQHSANYNPLSQTHSNLPFQARVVQNQLQPSFYFYDLNAKLSYKPSEKDIISVSIYNGEDNLDSSRENQNTILRGTEEERTIITDIEDLLNWGNLGSSVPCTLQILFQI